MARLLFGGVDAKKGMVAVEGCPAAARERHPTQASNSQDR